MGSRSGKKWGRRNSMLAFFHVIMHEDVCCINILWEEYSKNGCTSNIQDNMLSY